MYWWPMPDLQTLNRARSYMIPSVLTEKRSHQTAHCSSSRSTVYVFFFHITVNCINLQVQFVYYSDISSKYSYQFHTLQYVPGLIRYFGHNIHEE